MNLTLIRSSALLFVGMMPQAITAQPAWSLGLEPHSLQWTAGGENTINAELKNLTERTLWVFSTNPLSDYDISVSDEGGRFVPMTPKGIQMKEAQNMIVTRATRQQILPGGTYTTPLNLGELYSLRPGKYTVTVKLAAVAEDNFDARLNRPIARKPRDIPFGSMTVAVGR